MLACLVPLAVALARAADAGESVTAGVRLGFWFGLAGYGANLYWIASALAIYTRLAIAGYAAAMLVLAIVTACITMVLFVARRRTGLPLAVLVPACWVAGEFVLGHLSDLAFPWLPLGLATTPRPALAQLADVSGVHAVSFWIASVNGLLADAWMLRGRGRSAAVRLGAAVTIVVTAAAYGVWRMHAIVPTRAGRVAIVQPDIPQEEKWQQGNQARIVGILASSTRVAVGTGAPQLVLWPEAPLPDFLFRHPAWRDTIAQLSRVTRTPLLAGVLDVGPIGGDSFAYFNGAMLVEGDGRVRQPVYDKRRLVPIVERVPFLEPRWFASLPYFGGFSRGSSSVVFRSPAGAFGVLICYESIFPELSREYREAGAAFLVNLTNDAWFGRSSAPYQHLSHLVLRAIENRVAVVRAANTGFSGYIDPLGRTRETTRLFERATATYDVETTATRTLYDAWGDWVGVGCVVIVLMLFVPLQICIADRTLTAIADRTLTKD